MSSFLNPFSSGNLKRILLWPQQLTVQQPHESRSVLDTPTARAIHQHLRLRCPGSVTKPRENPEYRCKPGRALYYKPAFLRLKSSDRRRYDNICPNNLEWSMALTIFRCLKKFYDLTELLSGTSYPTANLFYRGFCEIKELLDKWCYNEEPTISEMAAAMSAKFEKYWKKSSTILAVACFFDPRYKKRLIEFYLKKFHGDMYQEQLEQFTAVVKKLYQYYASLAPTVEKNKSDEVGTSKTVDDLVGSQNDELECFLYDSNAADLDNLNELEKYMADPLLKHSGSFDILSWWKGKTKEYPILTQIARDILAVQVSTVASESAFSSGGRVIDPYRSSFKPEMVEALICTKDWILAERKGSKKVPSMMADLEDVFQALNVESAAAASQSQGVEDGDGQESDPDAMNDYGEV